MNPYGNEDVAWLHLQDLQREAENRRLAAGPSPTVATLRRLVARTSAAIRARQFGARAVERTHHA
jgi:hypothetical protein